MSLAIAALILGGTLIATWFLAALLVAEWDQNWTESPNGVIILPNLRIGESSMAKISDFITVGEAAAYLSVSKGSLRRWDRAGKLTARRHPHQWVQAVSES